MKEALVIAAVIMAAVVTGMPPMTTAYADFTCTHAVCAATDSSGPVDHDTSNSKIKITSKQSIVASGETVYVQNCAENNVNSQITSGDEGVDCHNNQAESEIQNQSATDLLQ
jgi:uncharacterized cupredoxin-like copper-binding protein